MPLELLLAAAIGLASGVASGMFGIGGAVLSTPGIRLILGVSANIAVGTTLPVIVPTAIAGVGNYLKKGFVDLRLAMWTAAAGVPSAVIGARTTQVIPGEFLMVLTAVLVVVLAVRMLPRPNQVPLKEPTTPQPVGMLGVGTLSGFLSGLLGVGGGLVLVPIFSLVFGYEVKRAIGTSLAVVAAQAIPGTIVHALQGNVDWGIAAGLLIGTVPGARLGSRWAVNANERTLRYLVAAGMCSLAVAWGVSELRAL